MLGNTLNSLDSVSKSAIPSLAPGSAIFTGTSFPLPVMVHIDQLDKRHAPSSDNANLKKSGYHMTIKNDFLFYGS